MLVVIIGAGIVGLHTARVFQERGDEVYLLETASSLGEETSGRNSGVIHSGVFYKPGSFKEKVCIEGNRFTYQWLRELNVNHQACGKWIVPEEGQEADLETFLARIENLPITKPQLLSPKQLSRQEPLLRPTQAIFIPSTGLVDAAGYLKSMALYLEERGVHIILGCRVTGLRGERALETERGEIPFDLAINAAGLYADEVARWSGLNEYEIRPCRGDYYLLNQQPLQRPVYHLPNRSAHGLGVHLTPTLDGQTLVGPNAFFIREKSNYSPLSSIEDFQRSVRFYLPHLKDFSLSQGYSGNRPKLFRAGQPVGEFILKKKGNWIHALGIESPGLTAAPALAREILRLL
ncbi:MAG: NAD(P)/FAD-dependent oxidoreductase [Deltaproteobacteria bacterium]|nr:NAD(P)/FAD-dependent oxidoreductase [Deltaproteobacteria bacterium]